MDTHKTEDSPSKLKGAQSLLWRILKWVPLVSMLVVLIALAALFFSGGLAKLTAWYLLQFVPPLLGLGFLVVILLYALTQKRFNRLILATGILALLSLTPALLLVVRVPYPASLENTEPAATVRLPADGPLKVAWGGDDLDTNYHVFVPDQRWAYDFVMEPFLTGSEELSDYGCYGSPVLAPIDGIINAVHDGEPDMIPGTSSNNTLMPTGNYVSLEMESGTYLVIAHLKPGSLLVEKGDTVKEGQPLGLCGNSGNTSEPHIHIHHQRQDPSLFPVNFAEGLPLYFRDHDGQAMPRGGVIVEDGKATAIGDTVQHLGGQ